MVCSSQSASRLPENGGGSSSRPIDSNECRIELPLKTEKTTADLRGHIQHENSQDQYNNNSNSNPPSEDEEDDDPLQDISDIQLCVVKSSSDLKAGVERTNESSELKNNNNNKSSNTVISDVSESDSEDDQTRSRTPLLARHSSLEQKQKVSCTSSDGQTRGRGDEGSMNSSNGHKRVSFSTRSLDGHGGDSHSNRKRNRPQGGKSKGMDHHHHRKSRKGVLIDSTNFGKSTSGGSISSNFSPCASSSTNAICKQNSEGQEDLSNQSESFSREKESLDVSNEETVNTVSTDDPSSSERRFVLAPQNDSMVGWNQAGGPFPSQWLFQAVNVAVKKFTSSMQPVTNAAGGK